MDVYEFQASQGYKVRPSQTHTHKHTHWVWGKDHISNPRVMNPQGKLDRTSFIPILQMRRQTQTVAVITPLQTDREHTDSSGSGFLGSLPSLCSHNTSYFSKQTFQIKQEPFQMLLTATADVRQTPQAYTARGRCVRKPKSGCGHTALSKSAQKNASFLFCSGQLLLV